MDPDVARVLRGYASLTTAQQDEFVRLVNDYINGPNAVRDRVIKEALNKSVRMDVGPTGIGNCPCCGR